MAGQPPLRDDRSYDDLVKQTESLVQSYTSGTQTPWAPNRPGDALDAGSVMVRLFARMAIQVLDRLNQVPEKNHLAFLDLLGAQRLPPEPARVPLTFHPADGSDLEPVVPAGAAAPAPAGGAVPQSGVPAASDPVRLAPVLPGGFLRGPR